MAEMIVVLEKLDKIAVSLIEKLKTIDPLDFVNKLTFEDVHKAKLYIKKKFI